MLLLYKYVAVKLLRSYKAQNSIKTLGCPVYKEPNIG